MAEELRLICDETEVLDGGRGFCFKVERYGQLVPAFVVRYRGRVFGYFNECAHVPARLDWLPGEFFDQSGLYLICSIHGALYAPETGQCLAGRCGRKGLKPLPVCERQGKIYLEQNK